MTSLAQDEARRIRAFSAFLTAMALLFGAGYIVAGLVAHESRLAQAGVIFLSCALPTVAAWLLANRGRMKEAAHCNGAMLMAVALLATPLLPFLHAAMGILVLVSFGVVLPYVGRRQLLALTLVCAAASFAISLERHLLFEDATLPPLTQALHFIAAPLSTVVVLVLLMQHHRRQLDHLERIEQSENRFRTALLAASTPLWVLSPAGRLEEPWTGWLQFTGRPLERMRGRGWLSAIHPEDRSRVSRAVENALDTGEMFRLEARLRRADAQHLSVVLCGAPVHDSKGNIREWIVASTDVTAVKEKEHELRRALEAREAFLGQASHELRTPITSLKLQLQALERSGGDPKRVLAKVTVLERQVRTLDALVTRLLDLTQLEARGVTLNRERVDLSVRVVECVELLRDAAKQAGCELQLILPEPVYGLWDAARLEQIVTNLVSNAIKYGAGAPVRVEVTRSDDEARLVVEDHGIGISERDVERIFGRFERAASPRHFPGIGLGLWIVHRLVTAHGGEIHVESQPGQGARFIVTLPAEPRTLSPVESWVESAPTLH